jgi:hypothetical protein
LRGDHAQAIKLSSQTNWSKEETRQIARPGFSIR